MLFIEVSIITGSEVLENLSAPGGKVNLKWLALFPESAGSGPWSLGQPKLKD